MKKILKTLCAALISIGIFNISANASEWVKVPYEDDPNLCSWYLYDDNGNMFKNQWAYLGGEWYYFGNTGVMAWSNSTWNTKHGKRIYYNAGCGYEINGKTYFFDHNGHMLHDCYISKGDYYFLLNSDGSINYSKFYKN